MHSSIQIVVFDLGGVMIRLADGWEASCVRADVPYRGYTLADEERTVFEALEERINTGAIVTEDYFTAMSSLLHGLYTPCEIAAIYQAVICEEFPGIYELVVALRNCGYLTACLSNTCAPHWNDLTNPALYPAISALDFRHASHLLGFAKPDPRIFRRFEAAVDLTPDSILFFDDREENILAAQQCGWHAAQIFPNRPAVAQMVETCAHAGIALPLSHL